MMWTCSVLFFFLFDVEIMLLYEMLELFGKTIWGFPQNRKKKPFEDMVQVYISLFWSTDQVLRIGKRASIWYIDDDCHWNFMPPARIVMIEIIWRVESGQMLLGTSTTFIGLWITFFTVVDGGFHTTGTYHHIGAVTDVTLWYVLLILLLSFQ